MTSEAMIATGIIIAYFILNGVAIKLGSKKQTDLENYAVGNRSFGFALNAFSYLGAWYVGAMYVGWVANSATIGVFAQYILIYSVGAMIFMYYMARPAWIWGKEYGFETEGDYIKKRYNSNKFGFVIMLIIFVFYVPWLAVEMQAIGYIISAATYYQFGFNTIIIVSCGFVLIYTFLGGARASAVGGLVQGLTIGIIGLFFVGWLIWNAYGSIGNVYDIAEKFSPQLLEIRSQGSTYWASIIITSTLGGFALPGIFVRLYMTDSPRTTKKAVLISPILGIIMGFLVMALALPALTLDGFPEDPQQGAFWLAEKFGGPVGLGLLGILGAAASASSISVFLNVFGVMLSKDLVGTIRPHMTKESLFKVARIGTIILGVGCMIGSMFEIPNLMFIVIAIYDCCVQIFPMVFFGLYWRRANIQGAAIGFAIGSLFALSGNFFPETVAWAGGWTGGAIGLALNILAVIICGYVFKKPDYVDDMFDMLKTYKEPKGKGI